jgi:hypothetical protein
VAGRDDHVVVNVVVLTTKHLLRGKEHQSGSNVCVLRFQLDEVRVICSELFSMAYSPKRVSGLHLVYL